MSSHNLVTSTSYPAIVGSVLVSLRKERGMNQVELSDAVGVKQATWSRVENGMSALSIEQLGKAAAKLGVMPYQILHKADEATDYMKMTGHRLKLIQGQYC